MKQRSWFLILSLALTTTSAAAAPLAQPGTTPGPTPGLTSGSPPDLGPLVTRLVDDTTRNSDTERRAFDQLLNLGSAGVPYIISHLGDARRLPEQSIWVRRAGSRDRQAQPWYVHDGLEFVLKVLTGRAFGPQTGHLLKSQRDQNTRKWVAWCAERYPTQATICRSGSATTPTPAPQKR